jgi:hypothetical protein
MITTRTARLEDCERIAGLAQAQIATWQRWDAQGRVQDVPYSALTIYERWLHGGAWMSMETAAIHLGRLLLGAGIALVAEKDGALLGYVEAYQGSEPEPFGAHLHVGQMILHPDSGAEVGDHLLEALRGQARLLKCARLLTTAAAGEAAWATFARSGARSLTQLRRFSLPARTGQGLYQSVADTSSDARQIAGWAMPLGRVGSARQAWESSWQPTWDVLAELRERTRRLRFVASGQDAYVVFLRGLYDARTVEVACWTPRMLSGALLTALRDWTYREGYRTLALLATEETVKTLGMDAEPDGYVQDVVGVGV